MTVTGLLPPELQPILQAVGSDGLAYGLMGSNLTLQQLVPGPCRLQVDDVSHLGDFYRAPGDISSVLAGGERPSGRRPLHPACLRPEISIAGLPEGQAASVW
jgi:hypothetical protein